MSGSQKPDSGKPATLRQVELPGLGEPLRLWTPPSVDQLLDAMDLDLPDAEERIPYWAEIWPSALTLAGWLLAGNGPREPGRALEIGSGLGLVGLAALKLGWDLTLSDRDPEACRWIARNLAENGLDPDRVRVLDWQVPPQRRYDCIIAADILYERTFAPQLAQFFKGALTPKGRGIIAEPGRPIADPALELLGREFEMREITPPAQVNPGSTKVRIVEIRPRQLI